MKTALAVYMAALVTATAAPIGGSWLNMPEAYWPPPKGQIDINANGRGSGRYSIYYYTIPGGDWLLTGRRNVNNDGTYTDQFRGTVSDWTLSRHITDTTSAKWLPDSRYLVPPHVWFPAGYSVDVTITNGEVTGTVTYRP